MFQSASEIAEKIVLEEFSGKRCETIPSITNLARTSNRYRYIQRPRQPRHLTFGLQEKHVPKDFLRADVQIGSQRHFMFATDYQLQLLSRAATWYMDGTFKIVKEPFVQLFSIHAFVRKDGKIKQLPLCFFIMSSRRRCDYEAVLTVLLQHLSTGPNVQKVVTDFENALWKAVGNVMDVRHRGCAFHWSQAVRRHMRRIPGLCARYSRNMYDRHLLRQVMALMYLPANKIVDQFTLLKTQLEDRGFSRVTDYVRKTWVASRSWPPRAWTVFNQVIRTNNDCESWHRRLNAKARGVSVNFYFLIGLLHEEAKMVPINVKLLTDDKVRRAKSMKTKTREARINKCWDGYTRGIRTANQLLQDCAKLHLLPLVEDE